ncbi:MAG: ABC transporter substrate-binding protein [Clostridiales bacterium]|nr:ABC transporter substrate-binding protein [Clostridiales bacterium]
MTKRIFALLMAAACILTVFAGCTKDEKDPGAQAKTKLTVVLDWTPNTNHTGLYVAQKNGYFADNGLEVTIEQPPEDGAEALVASGKAQFGVSFQENVASALTADSPLPITAVAALIQHNTSGIISLKKNNITSPKDMAGHSYASWNTPIEKAILKDVIEKDGGDFSKVKMIYNSATDVVTALQTNIDTVWIYYAWDGIATEVKGLETNYFAFKDINPALDFYTPLLIANDSFLKEHPDQAKAFLKAARLGYEYSIEHPEEAAAILCEYAPETDKEIAVASQKYLASQYKAEVERWGEFDQKRWDTFYDWLYENKVIAKEIPDGKGFTNDYLN